MMSRYDIKEFPKHLRILHVEQEILGDETTVLEYVLSCDVVRRELVEKETKLLNEQKTLTDKLQLLQENKTNENGDSKVNDNNGKTNEAKEANGDDSENKTENGNDEAKTNESKDNNESKVDEWSDPKKVQDRLDKIEEDLWDVYELMKNLGCDNGEPRAKEVLFGLGFTKDMINYPTKKLSGGWRMRVSLAGGLFVSPDILLLDEPTNHLDFPSVIW
eukprot:CAMPEP_0114657354 /NCGR_PEP_ID=MMETSP0191-20121206/13781_1 /TAXON_ID=126664 /ORGANISM="Sorites sp." /LENGTH=217 /DNA_ID=CAMNT_0001876527 /DNA_START=466 /DNA_END=1116 /DNA_ORIENTATION=+